MAKDKGTFFNTKDKHPWSKTKDSLLGCYLKPFFDKTYGYSQDGYVYVDAFAGPGKYGNGEYGSPILAIQRLLATARGRRAKCCTQFVFAEANSESRLQLETEVAKACGNVNYLLQPLIFQSFEEAMATAQQSKPRGPRKPSTVFYYVDPYGVKDLRLDLLCESPNPAHTEVLVNFNTIGFMRDGADALRVALDLPAGVSVFDCGFEDDVPSTERVRRLNACIGSEGWQDILTQHGVDYWERERLIGKLFCDNARRSYRYVTNMPIKDMTRMVGKGGEVKYRLVHMTNNADGCVLMNDNMLKRNNDEQVRQQALFKVDVDQRDVDGAAIEKDLEDAIGSIPTGVSVNMGRFAAEIINAYGVFDSANALLKAYLSPLLDKGLLVRDVPYTKTHRPKKSFSIRDKVHRP